jgi:hypothetical protein
MVTTILDNLRTVAVTRTASLAITLLLRTTHTAGVVDTAHPATVHLHPVTAKKSIVITTLGLVAVVVLGMASRTRAMKDLPMALDLHNMETLMDLPLIMVDRLITLLLGIKVTAETTTLMDLLVGTDTRSLAI